MEVEEDLICVRVRGTVVAVDSWMCAYVACQPCIVAVMGAWMSALVSAQYIVGARLILIVYYLFHIHFDFLDNVAVADGT